MSVSFLILLFLLWIWTLNPISKISLYISLTLCTCLGIITVNNFLYFFFNFWCASAHIFSSPLWVLVAHHIFLDLNIFSIFLFKALFFWVLLSENFKFPKNFIFLTPKEFRYFFVSWFWGNEISKLSNKNLDSKEIIFHFL